MVDEELPYMTLRVILRDTDVIQLPPKKKKKKKTSAWRLFEQAEVVQVGMKRQTHKGYFNVGINNTCTLCCALAIPAIPW